MARSADATLSPLQSYQGQGLIPDKMLHWLRESLFGYLVFLAFVWVLIPSALVYFIVFRRRWRDRLMGASITIAVLVTNAYLFWPIFTLNDGPFYSEPYEGDLAAMELYSETPLQRLGETVYRLEVRVGHDKNVFVLRDPDGTLRWQRVPDHDGPLGKIRLREQYTRLSWWGGWTVAIDPEKQEGGSLYLGPLGGFRYFYLSW